MSKKKDLILVDLEGTLSDDSHRRHLLKKAKECTHPAMGSYYYDYNIKLIDDSVNEKVVDFLRSKKDDYEIRILTAKETRYHPQVVLWLRNNNLEFLTKHIYMKETGDRSTSPEFKKRVISEILKEFRIKILIDDRKDVLDKIKQRFDIECIHPDNIPMCIDIPKKPPTPPKQKAPNYLNQCISLYNQRNKEYEDSYVEFGKVISVLFPKGFTLDNKKDYTRWGCLHMVIAKLHRYCLNFSKGGHRDSLMDIINYVAMLMEVEDDSSY